MSTNSAENETSDPSPSRSASPAVSYQDRAPDQRARFTLSVLVPVYNEQYLVETSLARLRVLSDSPRLERIKVIVVDDGSSDGTPKALERFRAFVEREGPDPKFSWVWERHPKNQGKGAAIRTGLSQVDTDLVVIHDADLEYHPSDLLKMVEVFHAEDADAVFGSRFMAGGYKRALFFRHALGNKLLTFFAI
jgi:glycosyltransferase involved in cell wall biosynthesis